MKRKKKEKASVAPPPHHTPHTSSQLYTPLLPTYYPGSDIAACHAMSHHPCMPSCAFFPHPPWPCHCHSMEENTGRRTLWEEDTAWRPCPMPLPCTILRTTTCRKDRPACLPVCLLCLLLPCRKRRTLPDPTLLHTCPSCSATCLPLPASGGLEITTAHALACLGVPPHLPPLVLLYYYQFFIFPFYTVTFTL